MTKPTVPQFLTAIGGQIEDSQGVGPYLCPLHFSQSRTLLALPGGDFNFHFRCQHSTCNFVGGPVELLREKRKSSLTAALQAFAVGGEFAGLFRAGLDPVVLEKYQANYQTQEELGRYAKNCYDRLKTSGSYLLGHLDHLGINQSYMPQTTCGKVDYLACPPALRLEAAKGKESTDALFMPYFNGPALTHAAVYTAVSGKLELYRIMGGLEGIFLERQLSWPTVGRVLICANELDALRVFCRVRTLSAEPINPIAVTSYGSLTGIPDLKEVILLSHEDCRIDLRNVLRCWHVAGPRGIKLSLAILNKPLRQTTAEELLTLSAVDGMAHVAKQLQYLFNEGNEHYIKELTAQALTRSDRAGLIKCLEQLPKVDQALIELIRDARCELADTVINKQLVRRNDEGYQIIVDDKVNQISNFVLYPCKFVETSKGQQIQLRLKLAGRPELSEPFWLPRKELQTFNRRLVHTLWAELKRQNFPMETVPDGETLKNFDWLDLLLFFDWETPLLSQITELGVTDRQVNFPRFTLDLDTYALLPPRDELHISEGAKRMHEAAGGELADLGAWKELLADDSPGAVAVTGALGHILHSLVAQTSNYRGEWSPVHLVFTSSTDEESLWESSFRSICGIFSNISDAPFLPADKSFTRTVAGYRGLGTLPFFGRSNGENRRLVEWLATLDGPAIILANPAASHYLGRLPSTCVSNYDILAFEHTAAAPLDPLLLDRLRTSFGQLLSLTLQKIVPKRAELVNPVPPVIGYQWLCQVLGVAPRAAVPGAFFQYPTADWVETPEGFFRLLSELLADRSSGYQISPRYRIGLNNPKTLGWWTPSDEVYLRSSRTIAAISELAPQPLNEERLSIRLQQGGYVQNVTYNNRLLWAVKREEWERLVERKAKPFLVPPQSAQSPPASAAAGQ